MDILDYFDQLEELSRARRWDELELAMLGAARSFAGPDMATTIERVPLGDYARDIGSALKNACGKAAASGHEAVLFRYELDATWSGQFFTCPNYEPFSGDEEWWVTEAQAVGSVLAMPALGAIYAAHGSAGGDSAASVMLALVGRTVATLGRQSDTMPVTGLAICAAYTGQEPFTRIVDQEGSDAASDDAGADDLGDFLPGGVTDL